VSRLETTLGIFEAHMRRDHIDIERNGHIIAIYPRAGIIENLKERRRVAEFISNTASALKTPASLALGTYEVSMGIMRGEKIRIIKGVALAAILGAALGQAEVIFEKDADKVGIHQEVIEEAAQITSSF